MTETLAHGYSSQSTHVKLSNEYQKDGVQIVFKNVCVIVLWTKVASALEGLIAGLNIFKDNNQVVRQASSTQSSTLFIFLFWGNN